MQFDDVFYSISLACHFSGVAFLEAFSERSASLKNDLSIAKEFRNEMNRFLPNKTVNETVNSDSYWEYLSDLVDDYRRQLIQAK